MNTTTKNVMPPLRKIARIEDKETGLFREEIEFPVSQTEVRRLQLAPSVVNNPAALRDSLLDHGAVLDHDPQERNAQLAEVGKSSASEQYVYEAQGGWLEPAVTFVLPDCAISANTTAIIGVSPSYARGEPGGHRARRGDLTSWRDTVGELSRLSSLTMFSVSTALAAPLLSITGGESFAFNMYGRTRSGKTIATLVAASLIGIGRRENLLSWNITEARLEERLAEFNDLVFPIDDLSKMKGNDREKCVRLHDIAYGVSHGRATDRHSSFVTSNPGTYRGWRCVMLTSAEKSIRAITEKAGVEREQGETLRWIDVPATFDNRVHILDRAEAATQRSKENRDRVFANIATDCEANHGAAIEEYVGRIINAEFDVREKAGAAIASFVHHVADSNDGTVTRDVAAKFGLVYAGGLLGIKFGIVLWQQEELLDAIAKCYRGARDLLPDEGVALRQGLALLMGRLGGLPRRKVLQANGATDWRKIDGYRVRRDGRDRYVIRREKCSTGFSLRQLSGISSSST
jgi:putative DNA primase/helicase